MEYYRIEGRKITYGEYWRMTKPAEFIIAAIIKALNIPLDFKMGVPRLVTLTHVDPATMPKAVHKRMTGPVEAVQGRGFKLEYYYTIPQLGAIIGYAAVLTSSDRHTVSQIMFSRSGQGAAAVEKTVSTFMSKLDNGKVVGVSNEKEQLSSPPNFEGHSFPKMKAAELLDRHRGLLNRPGARPMSINDAELDDFIVQVSNDSVDFHASRGVYVKMTDEEIDALKREVGEPRHPE